MVNEHFGACCCLGGALHNDENLIEFPHPEPREQKKLFWYTEEAQPVAESKLESFKVIYSKKKPKAREER